MRSDPSKIMTFNGKKEASKAKICEINVAQTIVVICSGTTRANFAPSDTTQRSDFTTAVIINTTLGHVQAVDE